MVLRRQRRGRVGHRQASRFARLFSPFLLVIQAKYVCYHRHRLKLRLQQPSCLPAKEHDLCHAPWLFLLDNYISSTRLHPALTRIFDKRVKTLAWVANARVVPHQDLRLSPHLVGVTLVDNLLAYRYHSVWN